MLFSAILVSTVASLATAHQAMWHPSLYGWVDHKTDN